MPYTAAMARGGVKTPCIGVCSTALGDRVCRGCKRFAHEVVHWNAYSQEQKLLVERRLADFLSRCVANKLRVVDAALLEARLNSRQIDYPRNRDAYCRAYCLLRACASQIGAPGRYGLRIHAGYRHVPLDELRRMIDEECYILSEAHYERYLGAAGGPPEAGGASVRE